MPPESKCARFFACVTRYTFNLHLVLIPFLVVGGLLYLLFSEFSTIKFATAGLILVSCVGIKILLTGLERLIKARNSEESKPELAGKFMRIGLMGALLVSWIPRIVSYFHPMMRYNNETLTLLVFVSLPTIGTFWSKFVQQYRNTCTIIPQKSEKRPWLVLIFNTFILLITVRIGMGYFGYYAKWSIIFTQIGFFSICTAAMMEYFRIRSSEFEELPKVAEPQPARRPMLDTIMEWAPPVAQHSFALESGAAPTAPMLEEDLGSSLLLECKICMLEFDKVNKIPRMLKECGHTLCESCADNLLNQSKGQHLFCPFCQKVTVVNGHATDLPKNFTIADMIDEKRKLNIDD